MRYLMLIYGNDEIWGDPSIDFGAFVAEVDAFNTALTESGELLSADGLVNRPRSIRAGRQDEILDGPYLEAKEFIGSSTVLDVESDARALQIARSYPGLRYGGGVEIWPLMEHGTDA